MADDTYNWEEYYKKYRGTQSAQAVAGCAENSCLANHCRPSTLAVAMAQRLLNCSRADGTFLPWIVSQLASSD